MRIAVDTSVLISVILFPNSRLDQLIRIIIQRHKLVVSSFVIEELFGVVERKFTGKREAVDRFLREFPYEMVYTPQEMKQRLFQIRDEKDYPVLYTAIMEGVDVFVTGDKDFFDVGIEKPEILTPAQFLEKYC